MADKNTYCMPERHMQHAHSVHIVWVSLNAHCMCITCILYGYKAQAICVFSPVGGAYLAATARRRLNCVPASSLPDTPISLPYATAGGLKGGAAQWACLGPARAAGQGRRSYLPGCCRKVCGAGSIGNPAAGGFRPAASVQQDKHRQACPAANGCRGARYL